MADLSLVMKYVGTYWQLRSLYDGYCQSGDREKFLRGHESESILFEAAVCTERTGTDQMARINIKGRK